MRRLLITLFAGLGIVCWVSVAMPDLWAQTSQTTKSAEQAEDVIKVYSELVQTDVMVFDKQGRFVNGLKQQDFELRVDGKPQSISFFDQVQAGTADEDAKLAAARGRPSPTKIDENGLAPLDRGRPVFFFVDDLHLTASSMDQTRKLLLQYIDRGLKQNDEAAIITATGSLGFLEQLTDNRTVLRTAVERLTARPFGARDSQNPPMSEYDAFQINRDDPDTLRYFVQSLAKESPSLVLASAEQLVRRRAAVIMQQVSLSATRTLSSLNYLIRASANVPGRKVLFLLSDGFLIDDKQSSTTERMRSVTSAASSSSLVIYSIDPRGLTAQLADPEKEAVMDTSASPIRGRQGETASAQEVLNALGRDTGGRALLNNNDLYGAVRSGLKETSVYYLLVWKPGPERDNVSRFRRLEVGVVSRPDLEVRVRRGFFDLEPESNAASSKEPRVAKAAPTLEAKLKEAISAPYPSRQIPISLSLIYLDTAQKGSALTALVQIDDERLSFGAEGNKRSAEVDLTGGVFDASGKLGARFREHLVLSETGDPGSKRPPGLTYTYGISLGPGLYQVRVVAHDARSDHVGGANAWIEIPDLSNQQLGLSSLIVGGRPNSDSAASGTSAASAAFQDSVSASFDRRFRRGSFLRYQVFVYNSVPPPPQPAPDVAVQVQLFRDDQPVVTTVSRRISTEGINDLRRLPYAAEISLEGLPPGRYLLRLTAIDRIARNTKSQQMRFEIY